MAIQKKSLIKNRETTKKAIIAKSADVTTTPVSSSKSPVLEARRLERKTFERKTFKREVF